MWVSVAAERKTRPTRFANRTGLASSSGPGPRRGRTSLKKMMHPRQTRGPKISVSANCSAARDKSGHQWKAKASKAARPITAWLKRGARASMTGGGAVGSFSAGEPDEDMRPVYQTLARRKPQGIGSDDPVVRRLVSCFLAEHLSFLDGAQGAVASDGLGDAEFQGVGD